jgi:hypothetical protein
MTDFRALCAELAYELDAETGYTRNDGTRITHPTVAEARAALAQPEQQGPTDEEAVALYSEVMAFHDCKTLGDMAGHFARAVLARWGRAAIEPVPVAERLPGPEDCDGEGWCWMYEPDGVWWQVLIEAPSIMPSLTHWLPHHALPVPQP